jgi:hypothetical protein
VNLNVREAMAKLLDDAGKEVPRSADEESDGERPDLATD